MSIKNELAQALQNISGKKIPAATLAKCLTTADVLVAFNALYKPVTPTTTEKNM